MREERKWGLFTFSLPLSPPIFLGRRRLTETGSDSSTNCHYNNLFRVREISLSLSLSESLDFFSSIRKLVLSRENIIFFLWSDCVILLFILSLVPTTTTGAENVQPGIHTIRISLSWIVPVSNWRVLCGEGESQTERERVCVWEREANGERERAKERR